MINGSFLSSEQERRFGDSITNYVLDGMPVPDEISMELREVFDNVTTCQNPGEKPLASDAEAARTVIVAYDEARPAAQNDEQRELTSKQYHLALHLFCSSGLNDNRYFNFPMACISGIRYAHHRNLDDARLLDGDQYSGSVYIAIRKCIGIDGMLDLDGEVEMQEKNHEGKTITITTTPRTLFNVYRASNITLFPVFKKMICSTSCKSFEEMNSDTSKEVSDENFKCAVDVLLSSENMPLQTIIIQENKEKQQEKNDREKHVLQEVTSRIIDLQERMLSCLFHVSGRNHAYRLWWTHIRGEKLFQVREGNSNRESIDELAALTTNEKDHYVLLLRHFKEDFLAKFCDDEPKQNMIHEVFQLCGEDAEVARNDAVRILRDVFSSTNPLQLLNRASEAFWITFAQLYPGGLSGNDYEALFYPSVPEVRNEIVEVLLKQRGQHHFRQDHFRQFIIEYNSTVSTSRKLLLYNKLQP